MISKKAATTVNELILFFTLHSYLTSFSNLWLKFLLKVSKKIEHKPALPNGLCWERRNTQVVIMLFSGTSQGTSHDS